jgi:hypothetical protein
LDINLKVKDDEREEVYCELNHNHPFQHEVEVEVGTNFCQYNEQL